MLTLYHFWSSTCSRKVRLCLAEKGLDWTSHHVDIVNKRDNLQDWYVHLNPNGVVPTLNHDGQIVIESNIILEYLEDAFPEAPLRPGTAEGKARMRLWMDKAETIVHKNINVISWNKRHMPRMSQYSDDEHRAVLEAFPNLDKRRVMLERLSKGVSAEEEAFCLDRLSALMDEMEDALGNNAWLVGDVFSLADIAIAPFVERFEANELEDLLDFKLRPKVGAWWRSVRARQSYEIAYSFRNPDV